MEGMVYDLKPYDPEDNTEGARILDYVMTMLISVVILGLGVLGVWLVCQPALKCWNLRNASLERSSSSSLEMENLYVKNREEGAHAK